MTYLGDIPVGSIIDHKFTTINSSGVPTVLAGTPVVSVYKDNSLVQSVAGITLSVDFDSVVGLNNVRIDTSADGAFYTAAGEFQLVITTGTVGGSSVVGYIVGSFSIERAGAALALIKDATFGLAALETLVDELESRLTVARAGYLDNLNVGGNVASAADLATVAGYIDTEVAAIKAKTDQLTFTTANKLDATIQAAGDFVQAAADKIWVSVSRTITGGTVTTVSDKTGYALTAGERTSIANALLDLTDGIEVGLTPRGALRLIAAACAGVASGLATATAVYRNAVANSKPRITATVDADGNRSAIVSDVT